VPHTRHRLLSSRLTQRTPAGFPCGIPGRGLEIEGATQQAPQPGRQSIPKVYRTSDTTSSPKYLGWENRDIADAQRGSIVAASGRDVRSEGCSGADLLRLALQLWRGTGREEYLDLAEHNLYRREA
jgi:hypothetical protein